MKTTLEIPDALFRRVKARAAERGQSLKAWINEALQEKLAGKGVGTAPSEPEWMRGFGELRRLRSETRRIQRNIDETFDIIEPEDRT